ncbi:hypothetical protein D1P53_000468 [Cryptococcus gattii VGV]|nr:hypothetical protein D1P53_000468 [Cryptococcus gattii VGV]
MSTTSASSSGPAGPFSRHTRSNFTYYPYILHNIFFNVNVEVGSVRQFYARLKDEGRQPVETASYENDGGSDEIARTEGNWYLELDQKNSPNLNLTVRRLRPPVQIPRSINLETRRMIRISSRCLLVLAL